MYRAGCDGCSIHETSGDLLSVTLWLAAVRIATIRRTSNAVYQRHIPNTVYQTLYTKRHGHTDTIHHELLMTRMTQIETHVRTCRTRHTTGDRTVQNTHGLPLFTRIHRYHTALRCALIITVMWGSITPYATLFGQSVSQRLTVRPHDMATGTQNTQAGVQSLDSIPGALLYVPSQLLGLQRRPLVIALTGDDVGVQREMEIVRPLADKYWMILLVLDHPTPAVFDAALKHVLSNFAIDPDKIAVGGVWEGGTMSLDFGRNNLDIFSRIAPMSANSINPYSKSALRNDKTEVFVSAGIGEPAKMVGDLLTIARQERARGHAVKMVLNLRPHAERVEDHDYMWRWLKDSWSTSRRQVQVGSTVATDVVLTDIILNQMLTFWTRVKTGQDSTRKITLTAYPKELTLLIGEERVLVYDMVDLSAIASRNPWVAAALTESGMKLHQEEDYRRAVIGARATKVAGSAIGTLSPTSVMGRNLAFLKAHEDQFNTLLDLMGVPRCETTTQAEVSSFSELRVEILVVSLGLE